YDVAEQPQSLRFANVYHHLREPVEILRFDTELVLPLRPQKIVKGLGQALFADEVRVVGLNEGAQIHRHPLPVWSDGFGNDAGEVWRFDLLQQVLAIERLERRARPRHDVDLEAPRPGLAHDALQEAFRIRAPNLDLHAVFLVEGRDQRGNVVGRYRGAGGQLLLPLGALDQPPLAIGALVVGNLGDAADLAADLGARARSKQQQGRQRRQAPTQTVPEIAHAARSAAVGVARETMAQFRLPC